MEPYVAVIAVLALMGVVFLLWRIGGLMEEVNRLNHSLLDEKETRWKLERKLYEAEDRLSGLASACGFYLHKQEARESWNKKIEV